MSKSFWDQFTTWAGLIAAIAVSVNAAHKTTAGTIIAAAALGALGYGSNKGTPPTRPA